MTSQTRTKKKILLLAAVFVLLACFFQFALIGYQTIVLVCLGLAVLTLLLGYVPVRWVRRLLLGLTVAGVLDLGAIEVPIIAAAQGDFPNDADYLVVLGAGVNGRTPSLSLLNRLTAAEAWLQANPDGKAILSGGQGPGEDISEAGAMYQWLTEHGIAAERLYKEETSATTRENFQYSAEMLQQLNGGKLPEKVAVLSSEYHLYRAKYLARQAGLEPLGVPAKTTLPVLRLNYFLREGVAVGRLYLLGY